jgi:galactose-1-phosphate uridylyltransferase
MLPWLQQAFLAILFYLFHKWQTYKICSLILVTLPAISATDLHIMTKYAYILVTENKGNVHITTLRHIHETIAAVEK